MNTSDIVSFAPPFRWRRALLGLACGLFLLVLANLQPTFETAELPHTRFDPGWVSCNTIAYGWPLGVLRFAADANCFPGALPDVEPIWLCVDSIVGLALLAVFALVAGGPLAALREFGLVRPSTLHD